MDLPTFRRHVLGMLRDEVSRVADAGLFLLYAPGTRDPLGLAKAVERPKRDTASVPWGRELGFRPEHDPRVIELDRHGVDSMLADAIDPLLETSIGRAHEVLVSQAALTRDEVTASPVCGWLASRESADRIAGRFTQVSRLGEIGTVDRCWVAWHDPRLTGLLWPSFDAAQRLALLGAQTTWVALDAAASLVRFAVPARAQGSVAVAEQDLTLTPAQRRRTRRLGVIDRLLESWRENVDKRVSSDWVQLVDRRVEQAENFGLDGRDLQVFVLGAAKYGDDFGGDPRVLEAVRKAAAAPGTLADHLGELPPGFWKSLELSHGKPNHVVEKGRP